MTLVLLCCEVSGVGNWLDVKNVWSQIQPSKSLTNMSIKPKAVPNSEDF